MGERTREDDLRLDAAYDRYERALVQGDRQEVTAARLTLCRLLESTGWSVPPDVRDQMKRDERTLRALAEEAGVPPTDLLRPPSHRMPWIEEG